MHSLLKVKLSIFMFIQCFTWGAWYVSMGTYLVNTLKFTGQQVGAAYGAMAIGAMISPFLVGLIADRYFATEKMIAALGLLGGAILLGLTQATRFEVFYPLLILYCLTYAPTLALANSLCLHHLRDPDRDFPLVKIFFSIGWIGGGVVLSLIDGEQTAAQFYLAGGMSVAMGLFALALPHTPPRKVGRDVTLGQILGLDALALLKKPSFAIFITCMFLICIPLYFYFVNMSIYLTELGWDNITARLSLAQVSDVVFLLLMPLMLKRLGYKWTIVLGIIAWATRYFLLSASAGAEGSTVTLLIFAAILVHGMCYDFLFVTGQLYVDREANERIRGAAQGLIAFIIWGLGAFVGTMLAGIVQQNYTLTEPRDGMAHDWSSLWLLPAWGAIVVLIVFVALFRDSRPASLAREPALGVELNPQPAALATSDRAD
jgi:nucleoside transporter